METETRRRAEILGELENIPFAVQGKICENRKKLADGRVAVYHNLQWWQDGKNHSIHIPENRLAEFEEAVRGGKRAKELLMELSRCDAQAVLSADSTSKKKVHQICFEGGAELEAIAAAALDSLAKDGIGCTAQLEHALDKAATAICRRLMSAILQSEAAKAKYEPKPGERNAGTKSIDIVSMFGPVGTISRTYYYDKDTRRGHYPWDEQMGLVGRYTPALIEEVARAAADGPYKRAAEEFARTHHFEMSGDTMQHIVEQIRTELTSFVKLSDLGPKEDAKWEIDTVYVLADGTGLPFRRNALKGVRGKNGKAKTREVKLGVVFIGGIDSEGKPFRLQDTTTYVATTHRWGKFMKLLRAEFNRRFGRMPKRVVFLSDGGKWLRNVKQNEFPFATAILDFYHATEHLEPVLTALGLKKRTKKYKEKFRYYCKRIKAGKIESVIKSAEDACPKSKWNDMRKALKYFRDNVDRMHYDEYVKAGLFIGSGPVESGCKTVLGARMKQSGMFWSLRGAKGMIPLRTLEKSGRLEEFFNYRLRNLRQVVSFAA